MFKRTGAIAVVLGVALLLPGAAQANFFGQTTTGRVLERGVRDASGFVGVFDDAMIFFGQVRQGLSSGMDGGLQFGLLDPEFGDVGLAIGGDLKFGLLRSGKNESFDLAINPRAAYFNLDNFSIFTVGASVVLSQPFWLSSGSSISPYGAVSLRLERVSFDNPSSGVLAAAKNNDSDTDMDIGAIGGLKWDASDLLDLVGEIVIDDEIGFIFGLNFKI